MAESFIFFAESEDKGKRLDAFILEHTEDLTRSRIKNLIESDNVKVNGETKKAGYFIKDKDKVDLSVPELKELNLSPENIDIDVVYEDDQLAVINKQQGLVVHPANGNESGTLVNALLFRLNNLSGINGVARPGIVHRLDKDTSGLLVVAKTDSAHLSLAKQISSKSAVRKYLAIVDGIVKEDEGIIDKNIGRSLSDRKKMAPVESGRSAVTLYKVKERFKQNTFVEFELKTGRTHQIRVHSKYIGHPVTGDLVYGKESKLTSKGQLLHAYYLSFNHPVSGERLEFFADPPAEFKSALAKLREL